MTAISRTFANAKVVAGAENVKSELERVRDQSRSKLVADT